MDEIDHREMFFKPGVSPTSINQFFQSPSRFWKFSSLNPNKERKEATPAMIFGRVVHCLNLTPEMFDEDFAVEPEKPKDAIETIGDIQSFLTRQGLAFKKSGSKLDFLNLMRANFPQVPLWDDILANFKAGVGKKTLVSREDYANAKSMQDAMFSNKAVRQLIGNGFSESPYCWFPDGPDGLMRKCKLDYVRQGLVIEYKTDQSPDPQDFSRTISNMGYHRQLDTQVEAAERMYGERPRGAIIIAQDKEMHEDIAIYAVGPASMARGKKENAWAWGEINRRLKMGYWRTFPEAIMPIELPKWHEANNPLPEAA